MSDSQYVLITGAGSGIGRETAYTFAERGASGILLADLDEKNTAVTADSCRKYATNPEFRVVTIKADVANRDSVERMVALAVVEFGRIDVAVNSAGVGARMEKPITEMPTEEFDRVHDINARGLFFCTAALARVMLKQDEKFVEGRHGRRSVGRGVILSLSSLNGQIPISMHVQYGASKYAAAGITFTAAAELARKGVRVNCIMPSWVDTNMMTGDFERQTELPEAIKTLSPAGRMAHPEEIAESIYFLASPGASYIHGIGLVVDAGLSLTRGLA